MTAPSLVDEFDTLLLDLDGTVFLGGEVIEHAPRSLAEAAERGARVMFVTNNASRSPQVVAESLVGMGIAASADDVVTSPEAAAGLLAQAHPDRGPVLVIGAAALADAIEAVGFVAVRAADRHPVAVVQGHSPETGWKQLAEGCIALRDPGVDWVATNTDLTLPTDRGLLPGNGSMVRALEAASGRLPRVAGKPHRPLLDEGIRRAGGTRPLVVGDRLDTDIEAAVTAELPSLMVLTGVSTGADLLAAPAWQRPTHLAFDLRGLIDPSQVVQVTDAAPWQVTTDGETLLLSGPQPDSDAGDRQTLLALAALARAAWNSGVTDVRADGPVAEAALRRLGLPGGR